jgi:raffinose synthase
LGTRNNQDSVILSGGSLKVKLGENGQYVDLLRGIDPRAEISVSGPSGAFVSFSGFDMATDRIDLTLGLLPEQSRFVCHSRIKRWWMAPSFGTTADDVPVETQLLLLELGNRASLMESTSLLSLFGKDSRAFARKQYAALIPLIDFDRGFRSTLFGQEGGAPAGKEKVRTLSRF